MGHLVHVPEWCQQPARAGHRLVRLGALAIGMLAALTWSPPVAVHAQTATDLSISYLEFIQVVQRFDNSIPLVRDKPILVRAYIQANGPNGPLAGGRWNVTNVNLRIAASNLVGPETPQEVLRPLNSSVSVAPRPVEPRTLRSDQAATFNFLIPDRWTERAGVRVDVFIGPQTGFSDSNTSNNSRGQFLTLVPTRPLEVVGLIYTSPQRPEGSIPFTDINRQLINVQRMWPIPYFRLYHLATDTVHFDRVTDRTRNDDIYFPGADAILDRAETLRRASTSHRDDRWHVLQPWDTGCFGTASRATNAPGSATSQNNISSCQTGSVMAQEQGHLFGQLHTGHVSSANFPDPNCCPHGGISRDPANPVIGFNLADRRIILPGTPRDGSSHVHDFQSYGTCPCWISDYTYERLLRRLRTDLTAAPAESGFLAEQLKRSTGGAAILAGAQTAERPYLFVRGTAGPDSGTLRPAFVFDHIADPDDSEGDGPYAIELLDADGNPLFTRRFDFELTHGHAGGLHLHADGRPHRHDVLQPVEEEPRSFLQVLPFDARTRSVVLRRDEAVLATLSASADAPVVTILTPSEGTDWSGPRSITWEASDPDGDPLTFAVQYSADDGHSWLTLAEGLTEPRLDVDAALLKGSRTCRVRVIASDGLNSTLAVSAQFGVDLHAPTVAIIADVMAVAENGQVVLEGDGYDPEDGPLPDQSLVWTLEDGAEIGRGRSVLTSPLAPGRHTVILTGTDSEGNAITATAAVDVPG